MRALMILPLLVSSLAACSVAPENNVRSPRAVRELDRFLAGKVAGAPLHCIPDWRTNDMTVVDDNTIIFRDGANRVYRNDPPGGCSNAGTPGYALVIRRTGGTGLCSGEIVHVTDLSTGSFGGTCSLGEFVPYDTPRRPR